MKDLELHICEIIDNKLKKNNLTGIVDYFSWGRDKRHAVDDTERLPALPVSHRFLSFNKVIENIFLIAFKFKAIYRASIICKFRKFYSGFDESYQLMSDQYSKNLFAELILMKLTQGNHVSLSSFTKEFVESYEIASEKILKSNEIFPVYKWVLRKITLDNPKISFFTTPTILNLCYTGRLYRYHKGDTLIEVEAGDIVIDAGVGWGDTTIYLAALADAQSGGWSYAFDILKEGLNALSEQCNLNPRVKNISPVLRALSDKDGELVSISSPSPGARVVKEETERKVETVTIDTFVKENRLKKVDFIKMDIEGAELLSLIGATKVIKMFKPKLAISVYHKWDDLLTIPKVINSIRDDYSYYLDCTTGFGGETILYCQ